MGEGESEMCGRPTPSSGWEDTEGEEASGRAVCLLGRDATQKPVLKTRLSNTASPSTTAMYQGLSTFNTDP